jgi:hypothetical protein
VFGLLLAILYVRFTPTGGQRAWPWRYASNGERIYFTATPECGTPISMSMGSMPMGSNRGAMMACADGHGTDGRGGTVTMMMGSFEAPDIRYTTLAGQQANGGHDGDDHEPYNETALRDAITTGIDPAGRSLDFPMPRWRMSDADLTDVVEYLETLR